MFLRKLAYYIWLGTLLIIPNVCFAFNYEQYKLSDLDEILSQPRPESGVKVLYPQKLSFDITLVSYATRCNTTFLKRTMIMAGAPRTMVESLPLSKCIKVKTTKGMIISMYIQDLVAEYLPKEAPLGSMIRVFGDFIFIDKNGPGILVNEFKVKQ